jgi:hypothetical protein
MRRRSLSWARARVPPLPAQRGEPEHWLLARRSLTDPVDIVYYLAAAPVRTLATRASSRSGLRAGAAARPRSPCAEGPRRRTAEQPPVRRAARRPGREPRRGVYRCQDWFTPPDHGGRGPIHGDAGA